MIPAPFHFSNIDREASLHPDVAAEIEAARCRSAGQGSNPRRERVFAALLRRVLPERGMPHGWSRMPAE